jgi:hypothetical protein
MSLKWNIRRIAIPGMRGGEIKENDGRSEFNYDIFNILLELL